MPVHLCKYVFTDACLCSFGTTVLALCNLIKCVTADLCFSIHVSIMMFVHVSSDNVLLEKHKSMVLLVRVSNTWLCCTFLLYWSSFSCAALYLQQFNPFAQILSNSADISYELPNHHSTKHLYL